MIATLMFSVFIGSLRGIAQSGSAPALGAGCREFESLYPDHFSHRFVGLYFSQSNVAAVQPIDCSERVNLLRVGPFSFNSPNNAVKHSQSLLPVLSWRYAMPTHKRLAKIYGFSVVEQACNFCNGELGICEIFQRKNVLYLFFDCAKSARFRLKSTPQRSFT